MKEQLTFTGEDTAMATLLLSVMGAFAEFERSLVREREGIAGPQARRLPGQGAGTGHRAGRAAAGTGCRRCPEGLADPRVRITRETVYLYLRPAT